MGARPTTTRLWRVMLHLRMPIHDGPGSPPISPHVRLVEFWAVDETVPIKKEHKMSRAQIHKEMNANGFKLVREYDGLLWQHLMFFGKAGEGAAPVPVK